MKPLPLFVLLVLLVGLVGAQVEEEQKSSIMITDYHVSPDVLMPNDIGTVTVTIKNMEVLSSVKIKEANLREEEIKVLSKPYVNIGRLGPGESIDLSFTIKAGFTDGIFYPKLTLEAENAERIRYQIPVKVDSTPLTIGVTGMPEELFKDERAEIELVVGNPRPNSVTGVKIVTGAENVIPSEVFVGALAADESKDASFNFTPQSTGDHVLNFKLEFKNGDNLHSNVLNIPVSVTESKKSAELILTGIEVESASGLGAYKITGDINNAGLEEARSVVMKVGAAEGVEAMNPYKAYFVGLLSPDDFSSFELDVKVAENVTTVPLLIEYKDVDGNLFSMTEYISIEHPPMTSSGELPVSMIAVLVVVAILIVGVIAYSWKKR
ncbi:MAG: hypothetical protein JW878_08105 [Methanomicrobia archaeon]|nr:hypothetical protein [Methanomicrobia archaeon]